jgi:hypothetical protein
VDTADGIIYQQFLKRHDIRAKFIYFFFKSFRTFKASLILKSDDSNSSGWNEEFSTPTWLFTFDDLFWAFNELLNVKIFYSFIDIQLPERPKLQFKDKVPTYPSNLKPPKMSKRLTFMRGPEPIHTEFIHKQYGIVVSISYLNVMNDKGNF